MYGIPYSQQIPPFGRNDALLLMEEGGLRGGEAAPEPHTKKREERHFERSEKSFRLFPKAGIARKYFD
jgi:hypothetical protein